MPTPFETFLHIRDAELRRISRHSREHAFEEAQSEAWLVAIEIGHQRGWPLDFTDQDDQDMLLARLYNRLVKFAEKTVRYAARLDHGKDDDAERTGNTLARLLTAPLDSDPQVRRQLLEERHVLIEHVQQSYSQAAAYMLLLIRAEGDLKDLAVLLWIGVGTLRERMKRVALLARVQSTLFDGIERLDPAMEAWRRPPALRRAHHAAGPLQPAFWPTPAM